MMTFIAYIFSNISAICLIHTRHKGKKYIHFLNMYTVQWIYIHMKKWQYEDLLIFRNWKNPGKKFVKFLLYYFCAFSHLKRIQWEDWQTTYVGSSIPQFCVEKITFMLNRIYVFLLLCCKNVRNIIYCDLLCVFCMMVYAMVFISNDNSEHVAHIWRKTGWKNFTFATAIDLNKYLK